VPLCDEIGKALARKTTARWLEILGATNVPHMIMNTLGGVIEDKHLVESGFWQIHDHPTEGKLRMASPPINFSKTPSSVRRLPPRLGEHSAEILQSLGYSDAEIQTMMDNNISKEMT